MAVISPVGKHLLNWQFPDVLTRGSQVLRGVLEKHVKGSRDKGSSKGEELKVKVETCSGGLVLGNRAGGCVYKVAGAVGDLI